jgi:Domain of unknown function (DUF4838)/Carbohydrate family 9 binding domain-like
MSRLIPLLCCFGFVLTSFAVVPRKVSIGKFPVLTLNKHNVEIVVPSGSSKVASFGATELKKILSQSLGGTIPVVSKPTKGKVSIVLGNNALSQKAGISLKSIPRDGFIIKSVGKNIYILGKDDPRKDPVRAMPDGIWAQYFERGTLFGVYDFLERIVGVRFYFPGKIGTVVPAHKNLKTGKIDVVYYPDFTTRKYSMYSGKWYEGNNRDKYVHPGKNLNLYRLRMETRYIPNCHGLSRLGFLNRFGKSNPEYFALMTSGKRHNNPGLAHPGQLCYNSKVRDEIAKDAVAFLSGKSAKSRRIMTKWGAVWDQSGFQPGYFNVMPQDGMYPCRCAKCIKYFDGGDQAMSEFIWEFTADIANRVKKKDIPGKLTMMAYGQYRPVPKTVDIPDNVMVMTAVRGPWNEHLTKLRDHEVKLIKDWVKKCGGEKTWLWNYANKYGKLEIPGLPACTPQAIGSYYKRVAPDIFGAYMQSGTDNYIFNHMNLYVFSKVCWDNNTDVDALLKEYYKKMYGPAAPVMEKIFKRLEYLWLYKIAGNPIETPLGPQCLPPADYQIWEKIYSPTELASMNKQFNQAEKLAKKDRDALGRVKFMRKEFFGPLLAASKNYRKNKNEIADLKFAIKKVPAGKSIKLDGKLNDTAWKQSKKVYLVPYKGKNGMVHTSVMGLTDGKNLYFAFDCAEPLMNKIVASRRKSNDTSIWRDSEVELFLNPSGDRKNYYQWLINAAGSMVDIKCKKIGAGNSGDVRWNSKAKVAVFKGKNRWTAEIAIPINSLKGFNNKGFPANFNRNRMLISKQKYHKLFTWSPFLRAGFHDLQNFGSIVLGDIKDNSIINNSDFSAKPHGRSLGKWVGPQKKNMKPGQSWGLDKSTFMAGGQSIKLSDSKGLTKICLTQMLPKLKPNTKYLLTFFVKTKDIVPTGKSGGAVVNIWDEKNRWYPKNWYKGTMPWSKQGFKITTGPDTNSISKSGPRKGKKHRSYIRLFLIKCTGTAWFDDVKLREIK